jgi:hypothetical protein
MTTPKKAPVDPADSFEEKSVAVVAEYQQAHDVHEAVDRLKRRPTVVGRDLGDETGQ